jgi:hypothetical protein
MHKKLLLLFVFCLSVCVGGSAKDGTPHIVKRLNLYNQTGSIGPITLYTPKHAGVFRVNMVTVITVGNGKGGYFDGILGFTDRLGTAGTVLCCGLSSMEPSLPGNAMSGSAPVPDEIGKPLTLSVVAGGDTQGAQYNVYVVVEEL